MLLPDPPADGSRQALQHRCNNDCRLSRCNGLGSSPFARHYSGSRGFFPFLRLLRCFSSPACHYPPYVFRREHARITTRRFPHSEIPGSKVGQHLTRAYRSRPRPSSALGAKASTVCPCSLDHEEHLICRYGVFKVQMNRFCNRRLRRLLAAATNTVLQNSAAVRSLTRRPRSGYSPEISRST